MSSSEREILMDIAILPREFEVSESIEALVHKQARMVFKIAYSVLRNHADAEDVAQEVFLRAFRNSSQLLEVRNQKAWIARIAWREALRRSKRLAPQSEELAREISQLRESVIGLDDAIAEKQQLELLRALIPSLPRDLRVVLVLSTVQEMSSSDIAEMLRIPEASVRTRMARARTMLKQKLEAMLGSNSR